VRQSIAWRRRCHAAHEITEGPARRLLDDLVRKAAPGRTIRLLAAPSCVEPAAFGLFRWTIILPTRAERDLPADELRSLLAHELAHLVRGDTWWLLIGRLGCLLGGFQPLNFVARREWQRAAEHLCDSWAIRQTGNRLALARCLTEVAGWRWPEPDLAGSLAATGRRSGLASRIEHLVENRPLPGRWCDYTGRRGLVAAMLLALIGLSAAGPRVQFSAALANASNPVERLHASHGDTGEFEPVTESPHDSESPAGLLNALTTSASEMAPSGTTGLLASLDDELQLLAQELAELQPLLAQPEVPVEAVRLADSLARGARRLEERRNELRAVIELNSKRLRENPD
jgi:hypothetical protein